MSKRQSLEEFHIGIKATQSLSSTIEEEQYKQLIFNSESQYGQGKIKRLVVTSLQEKPKLAFLVENLAIMFAKQGNRVLLVDADLNYPTIFKKFELSNNVGLSDLLINPRLPVKEVAKHTDIPNLSVLTTGSDKEKKALLTSPQMNEVIQVLDKEYNLVIFETPSLEVVLPTQILASKSDGVILSVEENVTTQDEFMAMKYALSLIKTPIISVAYCQ